MTRWEFAVWKHIRYSATSSVLMHVFLVANPEAVMVELNALVDENMLSWYTCDISCRCVAMCPASTCSAVIYRPRASCGKICCTRNRMQGHLHVLRMAVNYDLGWDYTHLEKRVPSLISALCSFQHFRNQPLHADVPPNLRSCPWWGGIHREPTLIRSSRPSPTRQRRSLGSWAGKTRSS